MASTSKQSKAKSPRKAPPAPRPLKPKGRTLAEFRPLRRCEKVLLEACRGGEVAVYNDGERPEEAPKDEQDRLRPGFVRFLCLGGDDEAPVHEMGVTILGGWIEGDLDLANSLLPNNVSVHKSRIDGKIIIRDAQGEGLYLTGSRIKGLIGDRVELNGGLFFRGLTKQENGKTIVTFPSLSYDEVRLLGARISGDLVCSGGRFENAKGNALNCDGAAIKGSVFFSNGFHAIGEVRLLGAQIGGNLECNGGHFENKGGDALNCDGAVISGAFFYRMVGDFVGAASVASLSVGALLDDPESWKRGSGHILDGFRYQTIADGPTDAHTRIAWLKTQRPDFLSHENFRPQPWQQLIRTLRQMGHGAEADEVAIAFQDQRRKAGKVTGLAAVLHALFGLVAGYGYKPMRLLGLMAAVWMGCGILYQNAALQGWIAPTQPYLFQHERYQPCRPENGGNWVTCETSTPPEYTTFNALAYSLDLILPLVELQQDRDWAPIVGKTSGIEQDWTFGGFTRLVMWFEILFGWVASLLLVAVLTGLTNREGKGEG